jgi:hypothetical protein
MTIGAPMARERPAVAFEPSFERTDGIGMGISSRAKAFSAVRCDFLHCALRRNHVGEPRPNNSTMSRRY